jgi:hypothetical protein
MKLSTLCALLQKYKLFLNWQKKSAGKLRDAANLLPKKLQDTK